MDHLINTPVTLPFVGTIGQLTFPDLTFLKDGVVVVQANTTQALGNGLFSITFTPTTTGRYEIYVNAKLQGQVEVVSKTAQSLLTDIVDEALGSWSWDKTTGVLTLLRQNGSTLKTYTVVDNQSTASRELI